MDTLITQHGKEIMTYAETVPSWFLLNLKVSKLRETYYSRPNVQIKIQYLLQILMTFTIQIYIYATCLGCAVSYCSASNNLENVLKERTF